MEENNISTKKTKGLAEMIFIGIGLSLLMLVPMLYSLRPQTSTLVPSTGIQTGQGTTGFFFAEP